MRGLHQSGCELKENQVSFINNTRSERNKREEYSKNKNGQGKKKKSHKQKANSVNLNNKLKLKFQKIADLY